MFAFLSLDNDNKLHKAFKVLHNKDFNIFSIIDKFLLNFDSLISKEMFESLVSCKCTLLAF